MFLQNVGILPGNYMAQQTITYTLTTMETFRIETVPFFSEVRGVFYPSVYHRESSGFAFVKLIRVIINNQLIW
jgi:hypothetical protein